MTIQYLLYVLLLSLTFSSRTRTYENHHALSSKNAHRYKEKFSDILLVINFNHPFYSNIEFLKKLYSPVFDNIVFYGEEAHADVFKVSTHVGYFISELIQDVFTRFPDYRGYLFVQDDCLMHFWNYTTYDHDKIWFAVKYNDSRICNDKFYSIRNFDGRTFGLEWTHFWKQPWAFQAVASTYHNLSSQELETLQYNIGDHNIPAQPCDLFYIPARFRDNVQKLTTIFQNVFCEIAVPTMLCCLDKIENWQQLYMLGGEIVRPDGVASPVLQPYPTHYSWIHPIKFSNQTNRIFIESLFEQMMIKGQDYVE